MTDSDADNTHLDDPERARQWLRDEAQRSPGLAMLLEAIDTAEAMAAEVAQDIISRRVSAPGPHRPVTQEELESIDFDDPEQARQWLRDARGRFPGAMEEHEASRASGRIADQVVSDIVDRETSDEDRAMTDSDSADVDFSDPEQAQQWLREASRRFPTLTDILQAERSAEVAAYEVIRDILDRSPNPTDAESGQE